MIKSRFLNSNFGHINCTALIMACNGDPGVRSAFSSQYLALLSGPTESAKDGGLHLGGSPAYALVSGSRGRMWLEVHSPGTIMVGFS